MTDLAALVVEIEARALAEMAAGRTERARGMYEAASLVAHLTDDDGDPT